MRQFRIILLESSQDCWYLGNQWSDVIEDAINTRNIGASFQMCASWSAAMFRGDFMRIARTYHNIGRSWYIGKYPECECINFGADSTDYDKVLEKRGNFNINIVFVKCGSRV